MSTLVKIRAKIRDITSINGEPTIVLAAPRNGKEMLREHMNLRERDFANEFRTIGKISIGDEVFVTGELSNYNHNDSSKSCLRNVIKIERISSL